MSDKVKVEKNGEEALSQATGFWNKNSKKIISVSVGLIILIGGYLGYKNFIQLPN
jgi:predicted negative regulator of RcsB-dependent stress response